MYTVTPTWIKNNFSKPGQLGYGMDLLLAFFVGVTNEGPFFFIKGLCGIANRLKEFEFFI
jgi:hypothetical protein